MKSWQMIALSSVVTLGLGGSYLYSVYKHRQEPSAQEVAAQKTDAEPTLRSLGIASVADAQQLVNTSVWMKNGYTITYFPYRDGKIDFQHRKGTVAPVARLDIRKIVEATLPSNVHDGIEPAGAQVFAIFTREKDSNYYALPIAMKQDGMTTFLTDNFFFFDDPHSIYADWPENIWKAIEAHQPIVGMTESQAKLAVGRHMISRSGSEEGNRSISLATEDKIWKLTFEDGKAVKVSAE